MENLEYLQTILPDFPRTFHAPIEPCAQSTDRVLSEPEFKNILKFGYNVDITEKLDGANCGITIYNGEPIIRNRNHILSKNFMSRSTPAKMQFAPIWNWFYGNKDKFHELNKILGFMPSVYGEWLYAQHTIKYDKLPSYFVAFDIYDPKSKQYISPIVAREALSEVEINVVPSIKIDKVNEENLKKARDGKSEFSDIDTKEGIYLKFCDGKFIKQRLKMVKANFIQGEHWNKKQITKNMVVK